MFVILKKYNWVIFVLDKKKKKVKGIRLDLECV